LGRRTFFGGAQNILDIRTIFWACAQFLSGAMTIFWTEALFLRKRAQFFGRRKKFSEHPKNFFGQAHFCWEFRIFSRHSHKLVGSALYFLVIEPIFGETYYFGAENFYVKRTFFGSRTKLSGLPKRFFWADALILGVAENILVSRKFWDTHKICWTRSQLFQGHTVFGRGTMFSKHQNNFFNQALFLGGA
jgi:hypothetical protein